MVRDTIVNLGTFSAGYVNTIINVAEQYGVSKSSQLEYIGVDDDFLLVPDNRVASEKVVALFHYVIHQSGHEYFGLSVGDSFKPGTFDMLGHAIMSCETLKEAIELNCRYQPLNQDLGVSSLEMGRQFSAYTWKPAFESEFLRPINEAVMAGYAKLGRWITWRDKEPIVKMHFTHSAPKSLSVYEKVFDTPIYFNMPSTQLIFHTEFLNTPLQQANSTLVELVRHRLDERLDKTDHLTAATKQLTGYLQTQLGIRIPTLKEAAEDLGYSERTLSRRLQLENTNFSRVLDKIRKERASYYINETNLSLTEITQQLGFRDQSAFSHAFKRWFSKSPAQFRRSNSPLQE